jgi:hypothetical protein
MLNFWMFTFSITIVKFVPLVGMLHQGREIIAIVALENGAFCTVFSENFHKF